MQADFETGPAVLILVAEHLVVVVHEKKLDRLGTGPEDLALFRRHQQPGELGQRRGDKASGEGLRAVLDEAGKQLRGEL